MDDPLYPLWHLVAVIGLRRGEACGLRWADVDLDRRQFAVVQQLVEDNGVAVPSPPKSATSRRILALDLATVAVLRKHRRRQTLTADSTDRVLSGHVFGDAAGRPLRPSTVTHAFARQVRASGLPPIRLHDLRHGAATLALAAGVDLKTVQGGSAQVSRWAPRGSNPEPADSTSAVRVSARRTPTCRVTWADVDRTAPTRRRQGTLARVVSHG